MELDHSHVFETYYRLGLSHYLALTADVQYMKDARERLDPAAEDPEGWIFGLRLVAEF